VVKRVSICETRQAADDGDAQRAGAAHSDAAVDGQRQRPSMAAMVVIMMEEARVQASEMACSGVRSRSRLRDDGGVDHQDRVLLDEPISRISEWR